MRVHVEERLRQEILGICIMGDGLLIQVMVKRVLPRSVLNALPVFGLDKALNCAEKICKQYRLSRQNSNQGTLRLNAALMAIAWQQQAGQHLQIAMF